MHPAPSVIAFTTLSGAGFGLLFWLGLGLPAVTGMGAFAYFAVAFGLAVGGLIFSTFHLGHPERAIKAFSQWRSSWLSREGVMAVAALIIMGLFAAAQIFLGSTISILGWIGAALSLITVYCTAMIYAQLKTVPRWNTWLTPVLFLLLSLGGGALMAGQTTIAMVLLVLGAIAQTLWWTMGKTAETEGPNTIASATGLGKAGQVRSFAPPHSSPNYLMKEFMFQVARRHRRYLRLISLILGFVSPLIWLLLPFHQGFIITASIIHLLGIATSRWLFFAEAQHVVGLYYGHAEK